jgi:16S rRNA (guanine1516-N2)-methyltransferase
MMPTSDIAIMVFGDDEARLERGRALAAQLGLEMTGSGRGPSADLLLAVTADGLELREGVEAARRGVRVDFRSIDRSARSLSRRQPLSRAIGREVTTVIDATAGLGGDAALLAMMAYRVTAIERSPIVAALLADGLRRAREDDELNDAIRARLSLVVADARQAIATIDPAETIYIDPMFPPKRKASALAKKDVRLVRRLVGDDPDAGELLDVALGLAQRRVVVKRPTHAPPVNERPPDFEITSKLVRYDVYSIDARRR